MLASTAPFTSSEKAIDPQLGYPPAYAKLCSHNPALFADSPPHCFLPYSLSAHHAAKHKELEALFPIIATEEQDPSAVKIHAEFLWTQLDHLGNAGFDPAKFRVDKYGNVLHCSADPSSPLAWEIDHWFPQSRGGKATVGNLRLVQWQVVQCKDQRLEFLVPWWDLQLGVSVNQFLSTFASKNADFRSSTLYFKMVALSIVFARQRAFSLLFPCSNLSSSNADVESHFWPQQFKQQAKQDGYGAAAVVKIRKHTEQFKVGTSTPNVPGIPIRRKWRIEEEEALLIALQKYRPVNWGDREKHEPDCHSCSDTDKVQAVTGCEEELMARHSSVLSSIQQEKEAGRKLGSELQQKNDQVARMEKELKIIKKQNEKEKAALEELESTLAKQKKRVEKQRRWSETQSHYRQCLERIIRDTLHQSFVFKEQARLNQAACTALLAKIQSHKMSCEKAELDLVKRSKERETLEILAQPNLMEYICRRLIEEGFLNIESFVDQEVSDKILGVDNVCMDDEKCVLEEAMQKPSRTNREATENLSKPPPKCMDTILEEDEQREIEEPQSHIQRSPLKRKVTSGELDINVGCTYQRQKVETGHVIAEGPWAQQIGDGRKDEIGSPRMGEQQQVDELLLEILTFQGKPDDVADANNGENEEQRVKRLGKSNVDKWLQKLLLNNTSVPCVMVDKDVEEGACEKEGPNACKDWFLDAPRHEEPSAAATTVGNGEKSRRVLDGLFRRMSFRHDAKKLKVLKQRADSAHDDVRDGELLGELLEEQVMKSGRSGRNEVMEDDRSREEHRNERRTRSQEQQQDADAERGIAMEIGSAGSVVERLERLQVDSREGADVFPSEIDFVKRMREVREEDKKRKSGRMKLGIGLSSLGGEGEEVMPMHAQLQRHPDLQHQDKLQKKAKSAEDPNSTLHATSLSSDITPSGPDKVRRSYSMRAASTGGRWVLHTRKGSDVLPPSTLEGEPMDEEVEIVLQPSSSLRSEDASRGSHAIGGSSSGFGGMGLKASLKTCTKAWKRAVSKRNSNNQKL